MSNEIKMSELGVFKVPVFVTGKTIGHQWGDYAKFTSEIQAKAAAHAIDNHDRLTQENQSLKSDRDGAISQMSKSWKHNSDNSSGLLTRYVEMAEGQLSTLTKENARLTELAEQKASRCDELYELLNQSQKLINATGLIHTDDQITNSEKVRQLKSLFDIHGDEIFDNNKLLLSKINNEGSDNE